MKNNSTINPFVLRLSYWLLQLHSRASNFYGFLCISVDGKLRTVKLIAFRITCKMAEDRFSIIDYVVFSAMLLVSALIGIWYACRGGKQSSTAEYLLANRRMNFLPVSISIMLSFLSAITLLGIPAEVYVYGTQFSMTFVGYFFVCVGVSTVTIPMFRRLEMTCVHEVRLFKFRSWKSMYSPS